MNHPFKQKLENAESLKNMVSKTTKSEISGCLNPTIENNEKNRIKNYSIKSFTNQKLPNHSFFVQSKGLNSGRPSIQSRPNCFVFSTSNADDMDFYFWLSFGLWQSNGYHPFLRGSVIPFITIADYKKCIVAAADKALQNLSKFEKNIKALKELDKAEKHYQKNILLIKQFRKAIFYQYQKGV